MLEVPVDRQIEEEQDMYENQDSPLEVQLLDSLKINASVR
jgi:hypothetical protein